MSQGRSRRLISGATVRMMAPRTTTARCDDSNGGRPVAAIESIDGVGLPICRPIDNLIVLNGCEMWVIKKSTTHQKQKYRMAVV